MMFGSVCSGIEAASVAWNPIGWKAAWLSEIDAFPSAVLAHRFPEVDNLGDMNDIPRLVLNGSVSAPDVFTGGTPCQAFSVAGMREGLSDPRGALTIKFVETANAIDHVRAARGDEECVIIWENVPGVLSDKENAFGCFLAALVGESESLEPSGGRWTDAGCVYGPQRAAAWRVLDAQYFGLAQRRRRVFVVASARKGFDPAAVLFESEGVRRDTAPSREEGEDIAANAGPSLGSGKPCTGTLMANAGTKLWLGNQEALSGDYHIVKSGLVRRLTPRECERLQSFPDDWTLIPWRNKPAEECPDGPRYKAIGNSWAVPVARWVGERIAEHLQRITPC